MPIVLAVSYTHLDVYKRQIGADAFGASPRADAITTVKLGKSVEDIDVQAFASLTRLENVEVSEENGIFIFTDGVLIKADNSLFFCMPNIIKDDYDMFDVLYDYISNDEDACGIKQIISGKMIANVNVTEAENLSLIHILFLFRYF